MPEQPRVELIRGLAVLAEAPGEGAEGLARALGLQRCPTRSEYADVFLVQLYPYASVHLGPEGMIGGEARDRVAGLWRALGLTPPAEPDHLAALLGLYASLLERESEVTDPAERLLLERARATLLLEHLEPWVFALAERIHELAPAPYREWARLLADTLRAELAAVDDALDSGRLSVHLRDAPALPDPRVEGGAAFLEGLLAPVRSGAILTRADLARAAVAGEVALRAGERRYVLEHLLAQDAPGVLVRIAAEVRRQASRHDARAGHARSGAFFAARARAAAALLEELAATGAESGETARAASGAEARSGAAAGAETGAGAGSEAGAG